jgi:hypothetical protein
MVSGVGRVTGHPFNLEYGIGSTDCTDCTDLERLENADGYTLRAKRPVGFSNKAGAVPSVKSVKSVENPSAAFRHKAGRTGRWGDGQDLPPRMIETTLCAGSRYFMATAFTSSRVTAA